MLDPEPVAKRVKAPKEPGTAQRLDPSNATTSSTTPGRTQQDGPAPSGGTAEQPEHVPAEVEVDEAHSKHPQGPSLSTPRAGSPIGKFVHLFVDKTSRGEGAPWVGTADTKASEDYVSRIPDISQEMETILETLGPSITDFHSRCKGSTVALSLIHISEPTRLTAGTPKVHYSLYPEWAHPQANLSTCLLTKPPWEKGPHGWGRRTRK